MSFTTLLALFTVLLINQALAFEAVDDGFDGSITFDSRVMGGQYARRGQFPYQVSIRNRTNYPFATGGIISSRWILTTASPLRRHNISSIFVVLGAHHITNDGTPYNLSEIILHENFTGVSSDIAVISTDRPIAFTLRVLPILVGRRDVDESVSVVLSGWGVLYRVSVMLPLKLFFYITLIQFLER